MLDKGKRKFIVACGGTGGHAFPGLAVAKELSRRGHEVVVWMSGRDIESSVLKQGWEGATFSTGARQLRPKYLISLFTSLWRCRRELRRFQPAALLAMGSYSSLPPVLAARSCSVKVVLHEANTVPGRAVEWLSHFADKVAISFETTANAFPKNKTVLTGLPVRNEIALGKRFDFIPAGSFTVFVTGGSQGAHRVNELMTEALLAVKKELKARGETTRPLYVIHQTGAKDEEWVKAAYAEADIPARVHAFENEMADAFASADLVVARAGASTCFELAAAAKPAFLIPLPSAMRDHQHWNAEAFAAKGAADEGVQAKLSAAAIARYILHRRAEPGHLAVMAEKMRLLARPDAAAKVADLLTE